MEPFYWPPKCGMIKQVWGRGCGFMIRGCGLGARFYVITFTKERATKLEVRK